MRRVLLIVGIIVVVIVTAVIVARVTSPTVDGIPCEFGEGTGYHVHAHLTIVLAGSSRRVYPPGNIGIETLHLCLFWVHTHDSSGMIHIEAPHQVTPTLGQFFDIWGQPLSRSRVEGYSTSPAALRIFVGRTRYLGDPRKIPLQAHTTITLELGPPYIRPPGVKWNGL